MGEEDFGDPVMGDVIFKTTTFVNSKNKLSALGIYPEDDLSRDRKNPFAADDLIQNDVWPVEETRKIFGLNWRLLTGKRSILHNTLYYRGNERYRSAGHAWGDNGSIAISATANEIRVRRDIIQQNQNGNDTLYTFDSRDPRQNPLLNNIVTTPEMTANHFDSRTQQFGAYVNSSFNIGEDSKLTVEGYYKKFDDLVVRANRSSFAMKNQGKGWASGIDVLFLKRFTKLHFERLQILTIVSHVRYDRRNKPKASV